MTKDASTTQMPANRMPLSDRIKKLTDTIRIHVKKPYGENKDDVELHEVVDGGNVIARVLKRDGKILESNASPDLQQSGLDEKVHKAVGAKEGDTTSTTPVESAKDVKDAEQMAPERPKEHEGHEAEGKEKIKAPDSKEKKTKEPKEAKKPDNSMSKMASAESAETQGAAPLEKSVDPKQRQTKPFDIHAHRRLLDNMTYRAHRAQGASHEQAMAAIKAKRESMGIPLDPNHDQAKDPLDKAYSEIKRVGDTLHYTRLGDEKKNKTTNPAVEPPHATQTPGQVATKAPATGPNQPQGTAASPQQPPAPAGTAAPTAKQPPNQRWKTLFEQRKKQRDMSKISGGKGFVTSRGTIMVKSTDELKLEKDVVEFKKPVNKPAKPAEAPKSTGGHQGMFDILKRGRTMKPGTRDQKIKEALAAQAAAGSPYAERRDTSGGTQGNRQQSTAAERKKTVDKIEARANAKKQKQMETTHKYTLENFPPAKPGHVRDMHRLKAHTQSGRPFRVMLASHPQHAELPGYHLGLEQPLSMSQINRALSNPIHPITKAVYAAIERGHDALTIHNPTPKVVK